MGNCKGKPTKSNTETYINYEGEEQLINELRSPSPPEYRSEYNLVERGYARLFYNYICYNFDYNTFPTHFKSLEWKPIFNEIKAYTSILFYNKFTNNEDIVSFCNSSVEYKDSFEKFIDFLYRFDNDLYTFNLEQQ